MYCSYCRNNFERATNLLCDLHLKSNVESKLQEFGMSGKVKETIVADMFGRQSGTVEQRHVCETARPAGATMVSGIPSNGER